MRLKGKIDRKLIVRKWFALFPINIDGDKRWLETVRVKGYYWQGATGTWYWESKEFINK